MTSTGKIKGATGTFDRVLRAARLLQETQGGVQYTLYGQREEIAAILSRSTDISGMI